MKTERESDRECGRESEKMRGWDYLGIWSLSHQVILKMTQKNLPDIVRQV